MIDINTVMKLKKDVKKLAQEKDRAKGRVEQLLKTLKEKFGCSSLKQARELLRREKKTLGKLERKYKIKERDFMEKWGDKLVPGDVEE